MKRTAPRSVGQRKPKQYSTPTPTKAKYKPYTIADIRSGLCALIYGKSKRAAAALCFVPPNTLARHFKDLTGKKPNVKHPLTKPQRREALQNVGLFFPRLMGQARRFFMPHEELLMVKMLEVAAQAAFPYNADALEATAINLGKALYGAGFTLGAKGRWRAGFEQRHKTAIKKVKSSSICQRRASSATKKVRDAVFDRFIAFLDNLVKQGSMTPTQRNNIGERLANADEVGGDERGKRKKVYSSKKNAAWRATTRDGDHNVFHVTLMFVSLASGLLLPGISLIHSAPGSKNPKMREYLYTHLPNHWHVRRTTTGSMTRVLFKDWAVGE